MARLAIRMPKMSMTMTEGEVSTWHVEVGDEVVSGDVVCEVMTDKVDMDVESTVSGTLVEITVESGMVDVGEPIGWVEGEDDGGGFGDLLTEPAADPEPADPTAETDAGPTDELPAEPEPESEPEPEPEPAAASPEAVPTVPAEATPAAPSIVPAVPRARALARERGIDLATVSGSGPDGLVRVGDVEAASSTPSRPTPEAAPAAAAPAAGGRAADRRAAIRAVVARTMTPSAAIPQFTVWRELHLDAADVRRHGASWTTVLLRVYAASLRDVPELLSRWEDDQASEAGPPAVALAVATDRGLLVPTFTEPDRGALGDVDAELREVVAATQTGRLDRSYLGVANGSLSNLGGLGVDRFQALLTPPQGSVLSLGAIRPRPVAVPGGVGLALSVEAGLTVDHRVADGVHASQLLARMAQRLDDGDL